MHRLAITVVVAATASLQARQQPAFKSGVELVTVPVTVTSRDHNTYIEGLTAADFELAENGERQVVTTVTRDRRPLSICFVVDSSLSMAYGNRKVLANQVTDRIVEQLKPGDEISIVFVGEKAEERLPWTRIGTGVQLNWGGWVPFGSTRLNDGLRVGFRMLESAQNDRRLIVMVTDGFENASRESTASIVKTRQESEITIVGIGVGSEDIADLYADAQGVRSMPGANADQLKRIDAATPGASETLRMNNRRLPPNFDYLEMVVGDSGGLITRVVSQPEVIMAAKNITDELQYEYLIGYTPVKPLDGKYRKIKVEVKRKGTFVRHRGGYLALPPAQASSAK
jgi:Mg-chelatase subunit ChlD